MGRPLLDPASAPLADHFFICGLDTTTINDPSTDPVTATSSSQPRSYPPEDAYSYGRGDQKQLSSNAHRSHGSSVAPASNRSSATFRPKGDAAPKPCNNEDDFQFALRNSVSQRDDITDGASPTKQQRQQSPTKPRPRRTTTSKQSLQDHSTDSQSPASPMRKRLSGFMTSTKKAPSTKRCELAIS